MIFPKKINSSGIILLKKALFGIFFICLFVAFVDTTLSGITIRHYDFLCCVSAFSKQPQMVNPCFWSSINRSTTRVLSFCARHTDVAPVPSGGDCTKKLQILCPPSDGILMKMSSMNCIRSVDIFL